jgi:hypothetical protein
MLGHPCIKAHSAAEIANTRRASRMPAPPGFLATASLHDFSRAVVEALCYRIIEDFEREVDFVLGDRDRRGDAEDAQAAAHDAGHHPEIEALAGDTLRQLRRRRLAGAILH